MNPGKEAAQPLKTAYALITAAKNESAYIARTLDSVVNQTVLPAKWVIVDDGSTDDTAAIVGRYQARHGFIVHLSRPPSGVRHFGAKAAALRAAIGELDGLDYEYIGNLDADVSFGQQFYQTLIERCGADPQLGITGGVIWEMHRGKWLYSPSRPAWCVGGATHFFRRTCFEDIGRGYTPLRYGGEDTVAEYCARDRGWKVAAMKDCVVYHHKPSVRIRAANFRVPFAMGRQEYHWGTGIWFELVKCFFRCARRPLAADGYARLAGYLGQVLTHRKRDAPPEIAGVVQRQQLGRLGLAVTGMRRGRRSTAVRSAAKEHWEP